MNRVGDSTDKIMNRVGHSTHGIEAWHDHNDKKEREEIRAEREERRDNRETGGEKREERIQKTNPKRLPEIPKEGELSLLFKFSYSSARPPECCKMFQAGVYEEEMANREARIRCVNASEAGELYGSDDDDDLVDRFDVASWGRHADVHHGPDDHLFPEDQRRAAECYLDHSAPRGPDVPPFNLHGALENQDMREA